MYPFNHHQWEKTNKRKVERKLVAPDTTTLAQAGRGHLQWDSRVFSKGSDTPSNRHSPHGGERRFVSSLSACLIPTPPYSRSPTNHYFSGIS